ncbi:hypothetical protein ABZ923_16840 [Streptomyces sp. NPDC046881]|uniref:effector-associated constant component EACC1 n=1 Tax=Streptomyces sp. NPDC046881 TaxID=3155374 RepID=UPI0033F0A627
MNSSFLAIIIVSAATALSALALAVHAFLSRRDRHSGSVQVTIERDGAQITIDASNNEDLQRVLSALEDQTSTPSSGEKSDDQESQAPLNASYVKQGIKTSNSQHSKKPTGKRAFTIGILGGVLAAVPILLITYHYLGTEAAQNEYIEKADRACSKHRAELEELGPEPWQQEPEIYTAYLIKREAIIQSALRDWRKLKVPTGLQGDVSEALSHADAAAGQLKIAADLGSLGDIEQANSHIRESERYATTAISKSRAAGLKVCPVV